MCHPDGGTCSKCNCERVTITDPESFTSPESYSRTYVYTEVTDSHTVNSQPDTYPFSYGDPEC